MALSNRERVAKGFELLREGLAPFVERELSQHVGGFWYEQLKQKVYHGLDKDSNGKVRWDNQALLKAMNDSWMEAFKNTLGHFERSWVNELREHRNRLAHEEPFTSDDTLRALDSMQRLLQAVGSASQAEEVQKSKFELQRIVFSEQARSKVRTAQSIEGTPKGGLRPWRELVTPHPDVASGNYIQAEFAADLHAVNNGLGGPEYTDPLEFFRRTFITDGLRELLTGALLRLSGTGGAPVVELQTNFGGGKTHSMLALYHLFGRTAANTLPGLEPILKSVNVFAPVKVSRAVLSCEHLSPAQASKKPDGTLVRTLWGEMAYQLGGKEGLALVAESDAKGASPGAEILTQLFNQFSPCLVLIDEWVHYARQTVDRHDLPSGSFESQASFAQALTEAAKSAKNTLVVASIPTSAIEIGGKNGEYALQALKNIFTRLGTPWRPASADEGFEIVRRRLFEPIVDRNNFAGRDAVINGFVAMYQENKAEFPSGCAEAAYRRKLEAAYPIHPDVFDQLYGEWSTLDKFQRTRGVLRLLAKAIHRLWESNDGSLLILPASLPMDDPGLKSELTRYLEDQWEPVISEDVDGPNSLPRELDGQNAQYLGRYSACRRVARTLYLGTAPGSKGKNPGIDDRRVRLGCAQPGENIAAFGDALRRISDRAKHVHQDGNRYWISTKTNLNRLADDRANNLLSRSEELHAEIVRRIKAEYGRKNTPNRGDFAGVHPCPEGTSEVEDAPEARLVILGPLYPHRKGMNDSEARKQARTIFETKGSSPRIYKNMLVFLAPDALRLNDLLEAGASFLAWASIQKEHEALNLDATDRSRAEGKVKEHDDTVGARIAETWTWALVPTQREPDADVAKPEDLISLEEIRIHGSEPLAKRTSMKLRNDGHLIPILGGTTLRFHLDQHLWKTVNHLKVSDLAEWFPRYLYLPRIVNREVLMGAIKDGLGQMYLKDVFAIASLHDETKNRYIGLQTPPNSARAVIENSSLLVKPDVAMAQVKADLEPVPPSQREGDTNGPAKLGYSKPPVAPPDKPKVKPQPTLFVGSVKLDALRLGRDAGHMAEEVLQHLSTLPGADVEVRLEIQVRVPGGVPDSVVRTVSENAKTLKFQSQEFEEE